MVFTKFIVFLMTKGRLRSGRPTLGRVSNYPGNWSALPFKRLEKLKLKEYSCLWLHIIVPSLGEKGVLTVKIDSIVKVDLGLTIIVHVELNQDERRVKMDSTG